MAKSDKKSVKVINEHGPFGFAAFVAWVGAFMYFAQGADGFGDFVWAFLQACVWPAILVFNVLKLLQA